MIYTKVRLAERVQAALNGGTVTDDAKVLLQDAIAAVDAARDAVLYRFIMDEWSQGRKTIPFDILYRTESTITNGIVRIDKRLISDLPKNMAIYQVMDENEEEIYTPYEPGQMAFMNSLDTGDLGVTYEPVSEPKGSYIKFHKHCASYLEGCKVVMNLILSGQSIDEDWHGYLGPASEEAVYQLAFQKLAQQQQLPADYNNDQKQ